MPKKLSLFPKQLVKDLTSIGFKINAYDPCVANKIINGKQMTILWHVDDLKILHVEDMGVTSMLDGWNQSEERSGPHQGKTYTYLGINLDYTSPGEVKISMDDYLK